MLRRCAILALLSLFTLYALIGFLTPATVAYAQGALVRMAGVNAAGRDVPIRAASGAVAARPLEVTVITTLSAANTAATLTIPSVAGQYHYLTRIVATRTCTSAITGTALLGYTSTNLPNSMAWTAGNACAVGGNHVDIDDVLTHPLKASAAGTNTTIVAPAAGLTGQVRVTAYYYTAE